MLGRVAGLALEFQISGDLLDSFERVPVLFSRIVNPGYGPKNLVKNSRVLDIPIILKTAFCIQSSPQIPRSNPQLYHLIS
jgi:hypothetical protein